MHIETYLRPALGSNIFNGNDLDNAGRAPLVKACTSGTWNAAGPLERSRADASLPQYSHRIGLAPVRDGVWGRVSAGPTNRPCLLHGREQLGNQEKGVTVHGEMHKESMVYWHPCPREAGQRNRNRRLTNSRVPRSRREGCRRCEFLTVRARVHARVQVKSLDDCHATIVHSRGKKRAVVEVERLKIAWKAAGATASSLLPPTPAIRACPSSISK